MTTIEVTNTYTIEASADRVWEVMIDEFEDVATWVTGLDASGPNPATAHVPAPDGAPSAGRACVVPGFGLTDERFTVFDPEHRRFGYSVEAEKIPSFVHDMENVWTIRPTGPDRCEVRQVLTAEAEGIRGAIVAPMLRWQFGRLLGGIRDDLRAYAETGRVSSAKAAELAGSR